MWEYGCFSTTTLARPRRPRRLRHLYAVPRTSLQCVGTRRRNCIEQLSPFSEYAPGTVHFPVRNPATNQTDRGSALRLLAYPVFLPKTGDVALRVFQPKNS